MKYCLPYINYYSSKSHIKFYNCLSFSIFLLLLKLFFSLFIEQIVWRQFPLSVASAYGTWWLLALIINPSPKCSYYISSSWSWSWSCQNVKTFQIASLDHHDSRKALRRLTLGIINVTLHFTHEIANWNN
jgi:hypothetical protein